MSPPPPAADCWARRRARTFHGRALEGAIDTEAPLTIFVTAEYGFSIGFIFILPTSGLERRFAASIFLGWPLRLPGNDMLFYFDALFTVSFSPRAGSLRSCLFRLVYALMNISMGDFRFFARAFMLRLMFTMPLAPMPRRFLDTRRAAHGCFMLPVMLMPRYGRHYASLRGCDADRWPRDEIAAEVISVAEAASPRCGLMISLA